jgi:hypothetical protein
MSAVEKNEGNYFDPPAVHDWKTKSGTLEILYKINVP